MIAGHRQRRMGENDSMMTSESDARMFDSEDDRSRSVFAFLFFVSFLGGNYNLFLKLRYERAVKLFCILV